MPSPTLVTFSADREGNDMTKPSARDRWRQVKEIGLGRSVVEGHGSGSFKNEGTGRSIEQCGWEAGAILPVCTPATAMKRNNLGAGFSER